MELSYTMGGMSDLSADLMSKSRYSSSVNNTPPSSPKIKGKIDLIFFSGKYFYRFRELIRE